MKKLVFSEKENRYVELKFTLDDNNQKVYNNTVQGYDQEGNCIKIISEAEREAKFIVKLEADILTSTYASKRMTICNNCDQYSYRFCKQCLCFLPFKVLIKGADCPINKWNAINE